MRLSSADAYEPLALWSALRLPCAEALGRALSEEKWHRRRRRGRMPLRVGRQPCDIACLEAGGLSAPLEVTIALPAEVIDKLAEAVAADVVQRLSEAGTHGDRWLTTREAADYLGLTVAAIRTSAPLLARYRSSRLVRAASATSRSADLDHWRAS